MFFYNIFQSINLFFRADYLHRPEEYRNLLEICWRKFEEYKDSGTVFNLKDHLWTLFLYEKGPVVVIAQHSNGSTTR
jgi:hypothetical protein